MEYDVLIVGGGPAGLSTAIRLRQLCEEKDNDLSVCLIEKGSHIGAHILSGNVFETRALDELIPNWKELDAPIKTKVTSDSFGILFKNRMIKTPGLFMPKSIANHGNYIISLSELSEWMGEEAEELGVEILPGISGDQVLFNNDGSVGGVITGDFGIGKDGQPKDTYMPGIVIKAKQTVFTEGCRGSLSESLKSHFQLDKDSPSIQNYGLGLKEVWRVDNKLFSPGLVQHTIGWPMAHNEYGGSFMYHMHPDIINIGLVVGLSYQNPYLNPYEEFQRFKAHPAIRKYLEGGECISYGARCLNEGGFHAIPKLTFPGGMMAGCSAGFLNVAKIKGSHTAIKTGMMAAEAIFEGTERGPVEGKELTSYTEAFNNSWVHKELKATRNVQGGFKFGRWVGLCHSGLATMISHGKEPWTFANRTKDSDKTKPEHLFKPIDYPKHDGIITFDLLDNLARSGTNHDHDQPAHLRIKPGMEDVPIQTSFLQFDGPEEKFCPAKVYEFIVDEETKKPKLQINAQNCLHCKCCSIKTPKEYIKWTVPEGAGGPSYSGM